ncbi:MAG: hypothetical protein K6F33_09985, partial [Bacteroidales bacterium]|nr:hypothetical protein [Bacteroidales bacterium]
MPTQLIKQHFIFYTLTAITMWLQFSINLWQSPQNANMDFFGNVFYCAGATSHSLILALIPYLIVMLIIAI